MRPIFRARTFCLAKKKILDLQVVSRINKTIRKLQWIQNTIMNTNVPECFDNVYISDGIKTALSTHWLGNIQFSASEQVRNVIKALQTYMIILLTKLVSKVSLKILTVPPKRLILDARLGPERASADWYITALKIQTKVWIDGRCKDGIFLVIYFHLKFKP